MRNCICFLIFCSCLLPGVKVFAQSAPDTVQMPLADQHFHRRSPVLACILSFYVPGAGQIYNGQYTKGTIVFGAAALSFGAAAISHANHHFGYQKNPGADLLIFPYVASFLYASIDAPIVASRLNRSFREKHAFTSMQFSPTLLNTVSTLRPAPGFSLVLR
jgi:Family of unknown function (DUF5683)